MKKNNKVMLIIIVIVFIALIVYGIITRQDGEIVSKKDDLNVVTTSKEFTIVNKIMNDYLLNLSLDNHEYVKNVTGNDVIITNNKEKYTYYVEKLYYVELENNLYFYVNGLKMIYNYETSKMTEEENDCYLINVYKRNKAYQIKKINNVISYYNDNDLYDNVIITLNKNNNYNTYNSEVYQASSLYDIYINYFKDILFVNKDKAYNLLTDDYKRTVGSLSDFDEYRETIYNRINNNVMDYSINGSEPNRSLTLILSNDTKLTIIESGLMNVKYKIEN